MNDEVIAALEAWNHGSKARWIKMTRDTSYGATCWEVILGNVGRKPEADWHKDKDSGMGSAVYAAECSFFEHTSIPPNVVYVMGEDDDWPGLAKVILAALQRAKELGI